MKNKTDLQNNSRDNSMARKRPRHDVSIERRNGKKEIEIQFARYCLYL